jgi:methionyl-tRNA formyltransferase
MILPKAILVAPIYGCINVHASVLPRWRGAAPIQRAIEAGDAESGVTIMQMAEGLDTGDMLRIAKVPISPVETSASLSKRLSVVGATALKLTLRDITLGVLAPVAQDEKLATYAKKLTKAEAAIDWAQAAKLIWCKVRAFNPWPVAFFEHKGERVRVWSAEVVTTCHKEEPGTVLEADKRGIVIACGSNALRITELQLPGGKCMPAINAKQHFV